MKLPLCGDVMVFSSTLFIFGFLPTVLAVYFLAGYVSTRARNLVLALAGYVFYGWTQPQFVPLMLLTTVIDWSLSLVIAGEDWRIWRTWGKVRQPLPSTKSGAVRSSLQQRALALSIVSNLLMLGYFKYFNFAMETWVELSHRAGLGNLDANDWVRVALPLGISFYTFQSLSYIIDVYRGEAKAVGNFVDFACFVSMFPHLVAGPILKFSFLAEQLESRTITLDKFARGVAFFALGLGKKVLLANTCATIADATFGAGQLGARDAWWGALAYSFQIYFDFSGYSDMAIGLALMLGFVFARNFDAPYQSNSITEFWRRWHISLSTWLREYLYIPLGGNRKGPLRTYVNLLVTMLLGGLWHGASWNFVIWGALHGGALAWERWRAGRQPLIPGWMTMPATFCFVVLTWVCFRAESGTHALHYLAAMSGSHGLQAHSGLLPGLIYAPIQIATMALAAFAVWLLPDTWEWTQELSFAKATLCVSCFWGALIVMATQTYQPFIYYIF